MEIPNNIVNRTLKRLRIPFYTTESPRLMLLILVFTLGPVMLLVNCGEAVTSSEAAKRRMTADSDIEKAVFEGHEYVVLASYRYTPGMTPVAVSGITHSESCPNHKPAPTSTPYQTITP